MRGWDSADWAIVLVASVFPLIVVACIVAIVVGP